MFCVDSVGSETTESTQNGQLIDVLWQLLEGLAKLLRVEVVFLHDGEQSLVALVVLLGAVLDLFLRDVVGLVSESVSKPTDR